MTREEIIRMAREAGISTQDAEQKMWWLERFAKLVAKHTMANIDPSKFMSYQEGYEAGVTAEREACAKIVETHRIPIGNSPAGEMACEWTYEALKEIRDAIRARGQQ